jgi:leucyl-tRNA synthetase
LRYSPAPFSRRHALVQDRYEPSTFESKWQQQWAERGLFLAGARVGAPKYYVLAMLPYPSGEMHMGHARVYSITDVLARYYRKKGLDVLHPFGWDSFGLPAENAAIKEGVHPAIRTPRNIASFKDDVIRLGISVDWSREITTSEPEYYKWNQWFFLRMLERGIVYRRTARVNFCPSCNTVLANEQVEEGHCWRCNSIVEEREIPEWAFRITAYADRLLAGLNTLDWPERIVAMQRNWIGRSDGLEIDFPVVSNPGVPEHAQGAPQASIRVFTTRADTIFGATYMAVAPDHPILALAPTSKQAEIAAFANDCKLAAKRVGAGAAMAEKLGLFTGLIARNPFTGHEIPVWAANFVLSGYGTGAVMAVPAHDERDFEFAKKYDLPIRYVIREGDDDESTSVGARKLLEAKKPFTQTGYLFDSAGFSGMPSGQARLAIAAEAQRRGAGKPTVNYHLRDWGVSRQRYWGTPIPIVYCESCDPNHVGIPVPDSQLPVILPDIDVKEVLTGKGEPPLAKIHDWVNTTCPKCGGPARREAETMDTFVDSTWYWARYLSPHDTKAPFARKDADRFMPIDVYVGGPEHAVMHLLYFRFWTMVMQELGLCAVSEPAQRLVTQGIVKGRDGNKMSKNAGNGVSPRDIIARYGADTARLFMLFAAPAEKDMDWSDEQIEGQHRFLIRLFRLFSHSITKFGLEGAHQAREAVRTTDVMATGAALDLRRKTHKTIARVTQQLERLQFNTGISSLMELSNAITELDATVPENQQAVFEGLSCLAQMLAPFAPHAAEELWHGLHEGLADSDIPELSLSPWPVADPALTVDDVFTIAIQVNGKLRGEVQVAAGATDEEIKEAAMHDPKARVWIAGKTIKKVVVIPKRLVNFVVVG